MEKSIKKQINALRAGGLSKKEAINKVLRKSTPRKKKAEDKDGKK